MKTRAGVLLPLVTQLKACPAQDRTFSELRLFEAWERFKSTGWERGRAPTPAVLAGLLLHDPTMATLLNDTEHAQLLALCSKALERYQQKTNPPNPLGKTIAATLKELT